MSTKQRLLFITTGGTIASVRTQQGLSPCSPAKSFWLICLS